MILNVAMVVPQHNDCMGSHFLIYSSACLIKWVHYLYLAKQENILDQILSYSKVSRVKLVA